MSTTEISSEIKLTIYHCNNAFGNDITHNIIDKEKINLKFINMACSSMVKDVFILRAFESGSDGVLVLVCREEGCRYVEGSKRAKKRVERVKKLLDEIKIDPKRLSFFNVSPDNKDATLKIIKEAVINIKNIGPLYSF
ncbi:MAG: hydrogenase iron-sulfur subunit [Desulfobacterales bacterium]|nr:hydrogenase iron-sulfur subunit [Desulfobacterales bacterium]